VAWLSGGEGLHNNHHAFPSSAKFSRTSEPDLAWPLIALLQKLSLVQIKPLPKALIAEPEPVTV
jgi:stearoyl-CoA desaturase (delta-9 desaturase)